MHGAANHTCMHACMHHDSREGGGGQRTHRRPEERQAAEGDNRDGRAWRGEHQVGQGGEVDLAKVVADGLGHLLGPHVEANLHAAASSRRAPQPCCWQQASYHLPKGVIATFQEARSYSYRHAGACTTQALPLSPPPPRAVAHAQLPVSAPAALAMQAQARRPPAGKRTHYDAPQPQRSPTMDHSYASCHVLGTRY